MARQLDGLFQSLQQSTSLSSAISYKWVLIYLFGEDFPFSKQNFLRQRSKSKNREVKISVCFFLFSFFQRKRKDICDRLRNGTMNMKTLSSLVAECM